jgi:hypothetical protein
LEESGTIVTNLLLLLLLLLLLPTANGPEPCDLRAVR